MSEVLDPLTDDNVWFLCGARGLPAGPRLVALCEEMGREQTTLLENTDKCIAVFEYGGDAANLDPEESFPIEDAKLTYNAAQNAVETVHSKVCKHRVLPMFLTTGGGYLARHRAKEADKAVQGVMDENHIDQIEDDVVMDALVTDHGAGAVKVIDGRERVEMMHIPIEDVWFDRAETRHRQPSCCYHVPRDGMDMFKALELFANPKDDGEPGLVGTAEERRQKIIRARSQGASKVRPRRTTTLAKYRVDIYEAWHPPTCREEYDEEYDDEDDRDEDDKPKKKTRKVMKHDGRHVVAVPGEDGTLIDEPWDEDHYPILLYVPRPRRRSIWGLSLMRSLMSPQREYEKLTLKIQDQNQKMGVSGFSASKQMELNVRDITSGTFGAGFVVETEGPQPPTPLVVEPVAQGTYAYADSIPRNMLERNGISTLAAASQVPAGLQQASGKALQVFEDFEDTRLRPYHTCRERWKIQLSWMVVCAAKRIYERKGSYKSVYKGKGRSAEPIDWKDLMDLLSDREKFVLSVFPVSALSKQPAAKFAQLTELLNAQAITVEQFKRLFDLPDLEAENEMDTANTDVIDRQLDIMVTTGKYMTPEPFDVANFELAVSRADKFYNVCRIHEVPDHRLQLIRDWLVDIKSLNEQEQAKAQALAAQTTAANTNMMPPGGGLPPPGGPPGMVPPDAPLPGMEGMAPPMAA